MKVSVVSDCSVSGAATDMGLGQHCAYPATAVQQDDTVVCIFRAGQASHTYDGLTVAQRSKDLGHTWSEPVVLFNGRGLQPVESLIQPVVVAPWDGSFMALSPVVLGANVGDHPLLSEAGFLQQRKYYKSHSFDGGRAWSEPENLPHLTIAKLGLSGKSFVVSNGELFMNAAYPTESGSRMAAACFSSDHGKTIGPVVDLFQDPQNQWNYDEANYTTFPDGTVLGLYWTWRNDDDRTMEILETASVHRSVSQNNGRNWSLPRATNLIGQVAAPCAWDEETVLVASNYRARTAGIRLWISRNRGETFDERNVIQMWDPENEQIVARPMAAPPFLANQGATNDLDAFDFGLPELHLLSDRTILMTYWCQCEGIVQVRACRFEVDVDA